MILFKGMSTGPSLMVGKLRHRAGGAHPRTTPPQREAEDPNPAGWPQRPEPQCPLPGAVPPAQSRPQPGSLRPPPPPPSAFHTNSLQTPSPARSQRKACDELIHSFTIQPNDIMEKSPSVAETPVVTCR